METRAPLPRVTGNARVREYGKHTRGRAVGRVKEDEQTRRRMELKLEQHVCLYAMRNNTPYLAHGHRDTTERRCGHLSPASGAAAARLNSPSPPPTRARQFMLCWQLESHGVTRTLFFPKL